MSETDAPGPAEIPDGAPTIEGAAPGKTLSPAAERALQEAAERRATATQSPPKEINGPSGPEPTRFGDWEKNGRATDF